MEIGGCVGNKRYVKECEREDGWRMYKKFSIPTMGFMVVGAWLKELVRLVHRNQHLLVHPSSGMQNARFTRSTLKSFFIIWTAENDWFAVFRLLKK